MRKWKNICIYLLLLLLTCGVVFLPQLLDRHRQDKLVRESTSWEYEKYVSAPLSSAEVIDYYYNSVATSLSSTYDATMAGESAYLLLTEVFADDPDAQAALEEFAQAENTTYYDIASMLIVHEGNPIALNFISIEYSLGNEAIEITFEEKTKTLLSAYYWRDIGKGKKAKPRFSIEQLSSLFAAYASDKMLLQAERFAFSSDNGFMEFLTCDSLTTKERFEKNLHQTETEAEIDQAN